MYRLTDDLRIDRLRPLIPPAILMEQYPITEAASTTVAETREAATRILRGADDRLLVVVGPCSIHDVAAAREYGQRLRALADHLAEDDPHALEIARDIVAHLGGAVTSRPRLDLREPEPPRHDPEELYGILPRDLRTPYDVREVIARLVDGSRFHEFKARYATTLVTGFAHLHGIPIGILANQGVLFSESALKATHFIELASERGVPSGRSGPAGSAPGRRWG